MTPPKPKSRSDNVSLWQYARLFRKDILSAQPERLYAAKMAVLKTPFFRSFLINQPDLIDQVLRREADDFPKSDRIRAGLAPLLGNSVFVTNGEVWKRQRRIIDPAFERGRLREVFPAILAAGNNAVARLEKQAATGEPLEMEAICSNVAADVIFRTLFSIPIENETAAAVFHEFQAYQRAAPILNIAALIKTGQAPDDLATKIMTTPDPETGEVFDFAEMVDQVAIFFLAGHETSASALGWALYLLALYPEWQERLADEARDAHGDFSDISRLGAARDVFREALRLYPPVPMMVRENTCPKQFRGRDIRPGAQIVISPWHLHRHRDHWDRPDEFDPARFASDRGREGLRNAFLPFSAGARVCPGAGFAMVEGPLILSLMARRFRFMPVKGREPVPVAQLTVRSGNGIFLQCETR